MKITNLLFRYFRLWPSLLLLPFTFASGQTTDLDVQILSPAEGDRVGIGEAFAVRAQIFHVDANSSDVVGEDITATVELVDPFGIVIASHAQSWDSFPNQIVTLDNDSTPAEQVILQMPWTEASKFHIGLNQTPYDDDDNKWTISVRVSSPSLESNIANNEEHIEIFLEVPDLEVANNISVQARNPVTGQFGNDIYPNSQLRVTGSINNIGAVMTQPGARFPVEARLFEGQLTSTTTLSKALSVDYERVILPASDGSSPTSVLSGSSVDYVISSLTLPPNAQGTYTIQVVADVASQENVYPPPGQVIEEIEEFDNNHLIVYIDVDNGSPNLQVVEDSFFGDTGIFRGLDPVRIGFTIRNFGDLAVQGDRSIISKVALSEDDDFLDIDDYILREFDLSASALGEGLKPNETINFDWVQQMPTNLEGDFYLIVSIEDQDTGSTQTFVLENTPSISLTTEAQSSTHQLVSDDNASELLNQVHDLEIAIDKLQRAIVEDPSLIVILGPQITTLRTQIINLKSQYALNLNATPSERPHTNLDGSKVVYEMDLNGIRQIYFLDLLSVDGPELVTRNFDFSENPSHGNGHSLRPRISSDGSTVVFHSRASNLVTGDFNDQEDVFLYRTDSKLLIRAHNLYGSNEPNKGSYYPDVNGDGTKVVFESEATNMQTNGVVTSGMQIFLWDLSYGGRGILRALTQGNARSESASIDDFGNGVVFSSYATDLIANDQNEVSDIFYIGLATGSETSDSDPYLVNLPNINVQTLSGDTQAQGGNSEQPEISGDGSTIVYRSKATNLVNLKGISVVEVVNGGAGYFGNPTVLVTDSGSTGTGAVLSVENAFDVYGQLKEEGVAIINHGQNYSDPTVTLIPDPTQPSPTQDANLKAHLTHPDGELYTIKLDDVTGTNFSPEYSIRITETDGVGADRATLNPSISYDGKTVVYSTKSSNLLNRKVTRPDGEIYFNTPVKQAQARAILVGGIGEIEVINTGSGYQNGFLKIEDHSGSGTGAIASYEVDSFGRISSITMVSQGIGYLLESTVVEVDNPRGGSGFMAGALRFPESWGIGQARVGGGKVHKIEMLEHGAGYSEESLQNAGSGSFFSIEGDGIDINADGFADAKVDQMGVKIDSSNGAIYLEQKFNLEILSKTNLPATVLTIEDANKSIRVNFANQASQPFTIGILGNDITGIRDDLIEIIQMQWSNPTDLFDGPQIDNNATGGIGFTFSALSGNLSTSNTSSVRIVSQSNLLFSGAGFTRATPIISPQPVIHGFSELLSGTTITSNPNGRNSYAANQDLSTDDIYLFDSDKNTNERVSRSHYGFPVNYLSSDLTTMPSNRFPSISGDARHVFFSSDASGKAGLAFKISNQVSVDVNVVRDIYHYDRKLNVVPSQSRITPTIVFPQKSSAYIIAETNASDPDQGISGFQVIYGGDSYRYPPTLELEGGGGEGATAVAVLKDGVIRKIEVSKPGYGYDPSKIRIKVLDDGVEHDGSTGFGLAVFQPIFNQSYGIESIQVLDGGSGYFPSSSTLTVLVDYNGSNTGYGFEAGPIYVSDGVVDSVTLLNKGSGYVSEPTVKVGGGGHEYPEGTPVHIRMVASEQVGISEVILIANGIPQTNRTVGQQPFPMGGGGFVDVVFNEPYFDVFWVPDRNPARGIAGVDGLGIWQLELQIIDSAGNVTRTEPIQIKVVNSLSPECVILTPEDNATFILDPTMPLTIIADAYDPDGAVTEVQFLVNNLNTDFNGTMSFVDNLPPYKLEDWRPNTIGEYEIKAIAYDNGLNSTISEAIKIMVKEPKGQKPRAEWYYPAEMNRNAGTITSFFALYYGIRTDNNYINQDYVVGSQIPLSISAADDGTIASVEFFVDNISVGFANQRYEDIYSFTWNSDVPDQALVYAKVTDDDGNIVRTDVKEFYFGSNLRARPEVELTSVQRASGENYEAKVRLSDVVDPSDRNGNPTNLNNDPYLIGDFSLELMANGANVSTSGVLNFIDGKGTLYQREGVRTYSYTFTGINLSESGFVNFQVFLKSRQGNRNYRYVAISEVVEIYVTANDDSTSQANISPIGDIVAPGPSEFARVLSRIDDLQVGESNINRGVNELVSTHYGSSYKQAPSIIIYGGGGSGAEAVGQVLDGAITSLSFEQDAYVQVQASGFQEVLSQGRDYLEGDLIFVGSSPVDFDYTKNTSYSDGTEVRYPIEYNATMDYLDGEHVLVDKEVWRKIGSQPGYLFGSSNYHSSPSAENTTEWQSEASYPRFWKKVGNQSASEYSSPGTPSGESQWEMAFVAEISVSDGVIDQNQSLQNGAIKNPGTGYKVNSKVNVIDISSGNGALGRVSRVDANGGVSEILITRGGSGYNALTTYFEIIDENGKDFESGDPLIKNGVISSYNILNPGESYSVSGTNSLQLTTNSSTGTGFNASVTQDNLTEGALFVKLVNSGSGYTTSPIVTIQGGSFSASVEGRKKPLQVSAGSKVYLFANANDLDGNVAQVRFYGNGDDLGVQTERQLTSIALLSGGSGYTEPPAVNISGGGGTGATAVANLVPPTAQINPVTGQRTQDQNEPRALSNIILTSAGSGYTGTPDVTITGDGNQAVARAIVQDVDIVQDSLEHVPGTGRWLLEWTPQKPGTYLIDLEITDFDGLSSYFSSSNQIIVLPKQVSKSPEIFLNNQHQGNAYTTLSNLRFTARARDIDGALEGVQFYVNGNLLGTEILSDYAEDQLQQPYSVEFSPQEPGVYTVFAVARDNSENYVMSEPVTFTCTTGSGLAPTIRLTKPTTAAEGNASIVDGRIDNINLSLGGLGYTESPIVRIYGKGDGAEYLAEIDDNISSATYSEVISVFPANDDITSLGSNYLPESTTVEFEGGFTKLNASGKVATAEFEPNPLIRNVTNNQNGQTTITTEYVYSIRLIDGGDGYISAPRVSFVGAPPGMQGVAQIDELSGRVVGVGITNQGANTTLYPAPQVFLTGGLAYSEILVEAFAEDNDPEGYITEVSFYVNGTLLPDQNSFDSNPDVRAPYQILWSPEGPGIYEIYATAEDSDGNLITSPIIRREAVLSKPPVLEFNPRDRAYGYLNPDLIDENGSLVPTSNVTGILLDAIVNHGSGYHSIPSVEFICYDENGQRIILDKEAMALATTLNGSVSSIKLLKDKSGNFEVGQGYKNYRKLSGTVSIEDGSDLLVGTGTDFFNEVKIGQPLLLVEAGVSISKTNLLEFRLLSFQSPNQIILNQNIDLNGTSASKTFDFYTYGTEVVISGGMNTSSVPISLGMGDELALGIRVEDPEGKAIRSDNFSAFVNGVLDPTVIIQGTGPFYQILWNPPDLGNYSLRVQVGDIDGARGISQPLDIRVSGGLEPTIRMVSPYNERDDNEGQNHLHQFAFGRPISFTYEAKDFDGIIDRIEYYANSELIGRWPLVNPATGSLMDNNGSATRREEGTNRYSVTWNPPYPGDYTLSAAVTDSSGMQAYAKVKSIKVNSPYKDGSKAPISNLVYPKEDREEGEIDPIGFPVFKPPAFTSASVIPLVARGYDLDGSFESINYYYDGQIIPSLSGYIQLLSEPQVGDRIIISDGLFHDNKQNSLVLEFVDADHIAQDSEVVQVPVSSYFQDLNKLENHLKDSNSSTNSDFLSQDQIKDMLSKYGIGGTISNSTLALQNILIGLKEDAFEDQRSFLIEKINSFSTQTEVSTEKLSILASRIGFNGIMLKHQSPDSVLDVSGAEIISETQSESFKSKGFQNGLLRFPSRDSSNYHFTQLWTPPSPGVFTVVAVGVDSSGNQVMSLPFTITATVGIDPPDVSMTSPSSGTRRSVTMVGEHAIAEATHDWQLFGPADFGRIFGVRVLSRGFGYVVAPDVVFVGSGAGARATATIFEDPADPRYGQIREIEMDDFGDGYFGTTLVEFRRGLGNEATFLNASASDPDGQIQKLEFIRNGISIYEDSTEPYALQSEFPVGYYEVLAVAKDDANNLVASEPVRLNVSTTRGAAPSGFVIFPLPPLGYQMYEEQQQSYFWNFVRDYGNIITEQTRSLGYVAESFTLTSNSYIHLTARATDSDGTVEKVEFYLNNKSLGVAKRQFKSHHYTLAVDLSEFGEQPIYRIDSLITDNAKNVIVPNNPIYLDVLPSSGSQPQIDIVLPEPTAATPPQYSMGGQIGLVVDAMASEGTLESVGLYANGRFIGDALLQSELEYGKQRYALNWQPENEGNYSLTAHVRDNMGTIIFTERASTVEIVEDKYDIYTTLTVLPTGVANGNNEVSRGSSVLANAQFLGPEGDPILMKEVNFFLNGVLMDKQESSPYSFLFKPPILQDRFVSAPLSWELKVSGTTVNGQVGTAIEYGNVFGITELPKLSLSPIIGPSSLPAKHLYDGMNQNLSVLAEGSEQALFSIGEVVLYGNGIEIMIGNPIPQFSQGGSLLSIAYEFDWVVDYSLFAKKNTGSVTLVAMAQLANDPAVVGGVPIISSNMEDVYIKFEGSKGIAGLFSEVTGETVDSQGIDSVISDLNSSGGYKPEIDSPTTLLQLLNNSERFQQRVDIIAAYHVALGQWHNSYSDLQDHISGFIPIDSAGTTIWLKDYIDYLLTSPNEDYLAKFGIVPFLVGDEARKGSHPFADYRMDFVQQCLENKYSSPPTFQQVFQGSNRMLSYWSEFEPNYWEIRGATGTANTDSPPRRDTNFAGANGYGAGECAVDLIYNLAKEIKYEGGLPYILYTKDQRELYRIVAYYFLYFGGNLSDVDAEEINELNGLGEIGALAAITNDYRWTSKFNKIWEFSPTLFDHWKQEWFGIFMDKYFPWVFHANLGWLYIEGTNQMSFWFYSSKQNSWFWTGADKNFPYAYSYKTSDWVYFDKDKKFTNTENLMLYDFKSGMWLSY